PVLTRIFKIIHRDEPSHWAPYENWLNRAGRRPPKWWERGVDGLIHRELLFLKLPVLFLNPFIARRTEWPDADEMVTAPALATA
ncbi:MAG: ferritin-like domain-containing protein, partial [Croceibacterium sp.]